ncbi:MAG: hypothetical protein WC444_03415 [Candidatus Paceibacterota bacterium]
MSILNGFTPQTRIGRVYQPGFQFDNHPFFVRTLEEKDGNPQSPTVNFFNGEGWEEIFRGSLPAKVVTLLLECSVTEQKRYESYKNNPTGEYRPYRGHGPAMRAISLLFIALACLLLGLIVTAVLLGFGPYKSILVGVLTLALLLWLPSVYFRVTSKILNKKFAQIFVDYMKCDKSLRGKQGEVVAVLRKVELLCKNQKRANLATVVDVEKEILRLLR